MSRSKRKKPILAIVNCDSEKKDKAAANRSLRRKNKQRVKEGKETLEKRENSDIWKFCKDGKLYRKDLPEKYYRK